MRLLLPSFLSLTLFAASGQSPNPWDDARSTNWPEECQLIGIPSALDGTMQPAYFYASKGQDRPLIVSLHTWSGGYDQRDTLSWMAVEDDLNYIHPDFRGRNNNPMACGSEYVIQDIEDAIAYAMEQGNVDPEEIHVTGVSGGGFATMLAYMNTGHPVRTFSAWVGISDLERWYHESEGRGNKYGFEIAQSTVREPVTKENYFLGEEEARKRSPMHQLTPTDRRQDSKLFLYAGIHDGYQGSVPITQSIDFYNKVVSDFGGSAESLVSDADKITLLTRRSFPSSGELMVGARQVHYRRLYRHQVELTIFEGGHERVEKEALWPMTGKRILILGDSNGSKKGGWVDQLQKLRFRDFIFNASVSGNTIGFDNLDNPKLNTLKQLDGYLQAADSSLNGVSDVVILLGTNDSKAVFDDRKLQVPEHLRTLIRRVKNHPAARAQETEIYVVSPPPYGRDEDMLAKYHGGAARIDALQEAFREVARETGCEFVDIYDLLKPVWDEYTTDGIHLTAAGHQLIADAIHEAMRLEE